MSTVESFVRFCESEFGTTVMDREAAYIRDYVTSDDLILDVGCGIGSIEERLSDHDIVGVDRSKEMIRAARDRASAPFVIGDATVLPITSASVGVVCFVATLEFISDIDAALAEATRPVVCFAYVTNEMGQGDAEFEKGDADGSDVALEVIEAATVAWSTRE